MNKLFKISSIALAFSLFLSGAILAFATHEDVKEVLADSEPEFYIGSQDMIANPIYNDGLGGSATLDESDAAYTLTLNNFTYNDTGHTNTLDGSSNLYSAAIFCNYLGKKNVVIKLIGTSNINLTTTTSNCNDGIAIHNSDNKSSSLTIETDESQSERARLNVSVSNGSGKTTRAIFCENNKRLYFDNCLIYATGGNNKTTSGVYARGGLTIEETAEIHATGGSTTNLTSFGLFVANSNFRMNGGIIYATGGNVSSTGKSIGAQIYGSVPATQDAGELVAVGGSSESGDSVGFYSLGTYNFNGGKITAIGGTSSSGSSYGIQHNQYSTTSTAIPSIGNNIERLLATGDTMAIQARMKNSLRGLGWDNVSGTGDPTVISISSSEGQKFDGYKKVILNQIKYVASANPSVDYDGSSHSSVNVSVSFPTSGYSISYKGPEDLSYSSTVPSFVNSGTYAVDYKIEASDFPTEMGTLNFTINKLDPTITAPVLAENVDYDGSSHNALASNGSATGGTLKFRVGSTGDLWETAPLTFSHAGNYQIFYKVFGDSNHNDSEIVELGIFTIRMAEITNISVSQVGTLTYNGLAQTATVSASATTVNSQAYTFTYSASEGGTYTSSVPSFTNAGSHTVYYKVSADNHVTATGQFDVTIGKADSTLVAPTGKTNLVYTGEEQNLLNSVGLATGGQIYYKVDDGAYSPAQPKATTAGNHTVYYKVVGDTNHNDYPESYLVVNIAKADPVFTAPVGKSSLFIYNGNPQELLQSAGSATGGTIYYKVNDGEYSTDLPTATNAGDYTVYYKVVGDSNHNDIAESSLSVHLREANLVAYSVSQEGTLTYNGSPQVATVSESVKVTGHQPTTFHYSTSDEGPWSDSVPAFTNAGDHTVYCYISAPNHFDTPVFSFTVTINKADSTLVAPTGKTNLVYTGEEQNLLNSIGSATGGQIYYKVDDGAYSPAQPKATTAGGHTVYYKVVGDSNHNNIDESSFSVIIGEASLSDVSVSATSAPYTGSALTPSVTANATTVDSSPVTFTYSTTSGGVYGALPTFTDAGTHTIYYKANAENHSEATGNFTFTINKVDPDYVAPTAIDGLVYTGSSQILINAGSTSTGTLMYRLGETGEFSTTLPAATEAGTYTIYYKVLGDENHNDSEIQSVVVTVALTPSTPEPGTPTNGEPKSFPVWAIVVILVCGVLLVFGLLLLLFFFALNKWAIHNGKPVRVYKIGKKDDKIKLLTLGFKVILKDESEIFDSKVDALKLLK